MCDLQKKRLVSNGFAMPLSVEYSSLFPLEAQLYLTLHENGGQYKGIRETMLMENCKYTSVPSVKSEQKPVFGGLGTWLNMTKAGWFAKTL